MKHYYKLVTALDKGEITIDEFIRAIFGSKAITEYQASVAYMIYQEDGGRKYYPEDFDRVVNYREGGFTVKQLLAIVEAKEL